VAGEAGGVKVVTDEPADASSGPAVASGSASPVASGSAPPAASGSPPPVASSGAPPVASARTTEDAARAAVLAATTDADALRRLASPAGLRVCKHFVSPNAPYAPTTCVTYTPDQLADPRNVETIRDVFGAPDGSASRQFMGLACRLESPRRIGCEANDSNLPGRRRFVLAVDAAARMRLVEVTHDWAAIH
jgi:hypothetical protein